MNEPSHAAVLEARGLEKAFGAIVDDPNVLLTGPDPFAKPNKAAQKYGFEVCGAETTD